MILEQTDTGTNSFFQNNNLAKDNMKKDLALYVINLKIAKQIKENKEKDYKKFTENMIILKNEKKEIENSHQETINKVIETYLNEVRK